MASLILVIAVGLHIPDGVSTQFNGLPRLDPNGENVCEFTKGFDQYTSVYPDGPGQHRVLRQESEESDRESSGTANGDRNLHPSSVLDLWTSYHTEGASVQMSNQDSNPMITDFFFYRCCPGWDRQGDSCSIALCDTPCLHGNCTSPNSCTCKPGWTGSTCEDRCKAGDNSGSCGGPYVCDPLMNECTCLPGYMGNKCTIPCPVGSYGPGCKGKCVCAVKMNENNTCDRYTGVCPITKKSHLQKSVVITTDVNARNTAVSAIDMASTVAPRTAVHEVISTMKIVFLTGVVLVAVIALIAGLMFHHWKRKATRNNDTFFERKKSWGALVIHELNEVNERRRKARKAEVLHNPPESPYDNPPTPPTERHAHFESDMDSFSTNNMYAGLREPDGQDEEITFNQKSMNADNNVAPIIVPEDESIYEVHDCGAATHCSNARVDSIYTNDSVFSFANRCKGDNSLLTPVGNAIENIETSESEYDYPYADFVTDRQRYHGPSTATEPRRYRRRRFGSRERRMRKGSSDGQMYSVLIRPDIEAVSYKQSYSDSFTHVGYASRIDITNRIDRTGDRVGYCNKIDSHADLYSSQAEQVTIGDSLYSKPREGSQISHDMLALPIPEGDEIYSRVSDSSDEPHNRFALGYLTSVRKVPSITVTAEPPYDYQPPVADHYQTTSSILQRNLFRHQFQTVRDKPTTISVSPKEGRIVRPNCLPIPKYHDYVNGKVISKPPLPRRHIPALPAARNSHDADGTNSSSNFSSPESNPSSQCISWPVRSSRLNFPSPDDLDSDNYLSLRFSERTHPMKPSSNI